MPEPKSGNSARPSHKKPAEFEAFSDSFDRLLVAMRRARSRASREVTGGELSFAQFQLVSALADGERSVGFLADNVGVTAPTVTRMLDGLERLEIVERRPSEVDRRVVAVHLTAIGQRLLAAKRERFERHRQQIFSSLSESERNCIAPLLNKLADAIEDL